MKTLLLNTINAFAENDNKQAVMCEFYQKALRHIGKDNVIERSIRSLYKGYSDDDELHRQCKALLSAYLYDMLRLGKGYCAAQRCLMLTDVAFPMPGYSICESLFLSTNPQPRELNISSNLSTISPPVQILKYFDKEPFVTALSIQHGVYCYKDKEGALVLLGVVTAPDAVLCDEERLNDKEPPLYFTESTHFVSPIYKLDVATVLLRELLQLVGYSYMRIRHRIVFSGNSYPINDDDMWEKDSCWKGRDLEITVKRNSVFSDIPISAMGKETFTPMLQQVLQVAGEHYDNAYSESRMFESKIKEYVKRKIMLA